MIYILYFNQMKCTYNEDRNGDYRLKSKNDTVEWSALYQNKKGGDYYAEKDRSRKLENECNAECCQKNGCADAAGTG